tara:strand:- start:1307 stop:1957 length:651 start_codon:yes stop_codon:yes gene_type:complete
LAKRLTVKEKEKLATLFSNGKSIEDLVLDFKSTKLTITRNLKKSLGEEKYRELIQENKISAQKHNKIDHNNNLEKKIDGNFAPDKELLDEEEYTAEQFLELTPLNYEIENSPQQDLASVSINEVEIPKVVYMIVDKNIELEIKFLKEYPDWNFLSQDELNRMTIEIFLDMKTAKRFCKKDQKVIKVPNTDVFKKVAPILLSRGISRIVSADKLIAL